MNLAWAALCCCRRDCRLLGRSPDPWSHLRNILAGSKHSSSKSAGSRSSGVSSATKRAELLAKKELARLKFIEPKQEHEFERQVEETALEQKRLEEERPLEQTHRRAKSFGTKLSRCWTRKKTRWNPKAARNSKRNPRASAIRNRTTSVGRRIRTWWLSSPLMLPWTQSPRWKMYRGSTMSRRNQVQRLSRNFPLTRSQHLQGQKGLATVTCVKPPQIWG